MGIINFKILKIKKIFLMDLTYHECPFNGDFSLAACNRGQLRNSNNKRDLACWRSLCLRWREPQDKDLSMASGFWKKSAADSQEVNRNSALNSKEMISANNRNRLGRGFWTANKHATSPQPWFHLSRELKHIILISDLYTELKNECCFKPIRLLQFVMHQ